MARLRSQTGTYDQGIIASASAPGAARIGQLWFNNSTGVLYQYMHDGTSNFWLDISSGGIGTSISEGVDFVGDTDPIKSTNGTGLAVGSVYLNREKNRYFVCTDATSGANVWSGRYGGNGGTVTEFTSGTDNYRVHIFTRVGTTDALFIDDMTLECDILLVGGGGGGGNYLGGGGGGGEVLYVQSRDIVHGTYSVSVGSGGKGGVYNLKSGAGGKGSYFGDDYATTNLYVRGGGGGSGHGDGAATVAGTHADGTASVEFAGTGNGGGGASAGASGGTGYDPSDRSESAPAGETWTLSGSKTGGNGVAAGNHTAGSGAGAGAVGTNGSAGSPTGGNGVQINFDGNNWYWGGGGGGSGGASTTSNAGGNGGLGGGGGGGSQANGGGTGGGTAKNTGEASSGHSFGGDAGVNTGGGGGGGSHGDFDGGDGGSGIVMIRYKVT